MDPPRIDNRTEFLAEPFPIVEDGERLVLVVKATFLYLRQAGAVALGARREQRTIRAADIFWGDPEKTAIKYPGDLSLHKPGTDVIVVAAAHSPGDMPVAFFDAAVRVGPLQKVIRVYGLRVWQANGAGVSAPHTTTGIDVRYDYAWGGLDVTDMSRPVEEPRNPVGLGIARDLSRLTHTPAPFIDKILRA